ncbi:hypothetical protein CRV24_001538 [Beauveria bassiana]|nr:hypothetical protein CRV24_001538 [Beauveria bassiana]
MSYAQDQPKKRDRSNENFKKRWRTFVKNGFLTHRDYHAAVYISLRRKGQVYVFKSSDRAWPLTPEDLCFLDWHLATASKPLSSSGHAAELVDPQAVQALVYGISHNQAEVAACVAAHPDSVPLIYSVLATAEPSNLPTPPAQPLGLEAVGAADESSSSDDPPSSENSHATSKKPDNAYKRAVAMANHLTRELGSVNILTELQHDLQRERARADHNAQRAKPELRSQSEQGAGNHPDNLEDDCHSLQPSPRFKTAAESARRLKIKDRDALFARIAARHPNLKHDITALTYILSYFFYNKTLPEWTILLENLPEADIVIKGLPELLNCVEINPQFAVDGGDAAMLPNEQPLNSLIDSSMCEYEYTEDGLTECTPLSLAHDPEFIPPGADVVPEGLSFDTVVTNGVDESLHADSYMEMLMSSDEFQLFSQ